MDEAADHSITTIHLQSKRFIISSLLQENHVRAEPTVISRLCPHCGRSNKTVRQAQKTLFVRDLPSHGKAVAIHLDVPRLGHEYQANWRQNENATRRSGAHLMTAML